jgi:hypothetical protein
MRPDTYMLQSKLSGCMVAGIDYFSYEIVLCDNNRLQKNRGNNIWLAVLDGVIVITGGIETLGNFTTHDGVNELNSSLPEYAGILEDSCILFSSEN